MSPERLESRFLILRGKRPQLAAGEGPVVMSLSLGPEHALPQHVAVGLVVVRRDAGAQKVSLVVAAQCSPARLAFDHQAYTRLTGGSVELAQGVRVSSARKESH